MSKFRQAKSRILHGNNEDGFASPIFDVAEALRQLEKERKVELARLYREFHGLDPDPFNDEFKIFERELAELNGDSDTYYRRKGFKNGKPNKVGVFVEKGICPKCGRMLKNCVCKDKEESDSLEWLKMS